MKQIFALLLGLFLAFRPVSAAYAIGNQYNAVDNSSGTSMTTPSVIYAAHDRAVVFVTYGSGTTDVETVSDGTNTYTKLGSTLNDATNGQSMAVFELLDATAGTYTVTFSVATAQAARAMAIKAYSGLSNTGAGQLASNNQSAPGNGANAVTTGTVTPAAQPGALVAASFDDQGSETTITASGTFTSRGAFTTWDASFGTKSMSEDTRITSTSAVAGTFTAGSGTGRFLNMAVFVQEPGAGGGGGSAPPSGILLRGSGK